MGFSIGTSEQKSQQQSKQKATSSSQATSNPVDLTPEAFKEMQPDLATSLVNWFTGGNPTLTPEGGGFGGGGASGVWSQYGEQNFASPITGNETQLLDQLMGDAGGDSGRQGLISDTMAGKYVDPNSNPFLKDYISAAQRTTLEGLTETLDRTLPGRFTQAGQFVQPGGSSAFDRAAAIATRGAANAIGDIATNIGYNAYQGERANQQAAIGLSQQETQTTIANLTAQALPRVIQQFGVDKGLEVFKTQLTGILDVLRTAASLAQPTIGQESQSTSQSESKGKATGSSSGSSFNLGITAPGASGGVAQ